MRTTIKGFLGAATLVCAASTAQASTITVIEATCDASIANAVSITADQCGGAGRDDVSAVNFGAADGNFFSLGLQTGALFGGLAIFELTPAFTGPAMVVEVTNPSKHWEAADVFVGNGFDGTNTSVFQLVGRVNNGKGGSEAASNTLSFSGVFSFIAFQDASFDEYGTFASTGNRTADGFDLDSFTVAAVPLPASAFLLGGALLGMGAMRRRKAAATG